MTLILYLLLTPYVYPWLNRYDPNNSMIKRIDVPQNFERVVVENNSFADWLRHLPLKPDNPPFRLYDGTEKLYQDGHYAILDINIGKTDLQQCADAIIRLYAEYLYAQNDLDEIQFKLTNGDLTAFRQWILGYRPMVDENSITWTKRAAHDSSYQTFVSYITFVFTYAGTYSLSKQLRTVDDMTDIAIGDIFVQGGFPGHAVLVVDMAINSKTGEKIFLLCQSYTPAQDIYILKNLQNQELSPWYTVDLSDTLYTPEWTFTLRDLMRF